MGIVIKVRFRRHARASSSGYKSGRSSCLDTPDALSTASTRSGGTSSHCETACTVTPIDSASLESPPTFSIARRKARLSFMADISSMALNQSQSLLHWKPKAKLYDGGMKLMGANIRQARELLPLTLESVGEAMGVSPQAVQQWESGRTKSLSHDKIKRLAKLLKVPISYIDGDADPQDDDFQLMFAALMPEQKQMVTTVIEAFTKENYEKLKRETADGQ